MASLTVLTLNCMLLPITRGVTLAASQAAVWLTKCMGDVDVLVLQEVFDPLGAMTIRSGLVATWPYQVRPLGNKRGVNGGVMIASKWPLTHVAAFEYSHGVGGDALAAKGAVAATVHKTGSKPVVVVGTHMQAGRDATARAIRRSQWQELGWFTNTWLAQRAGDSALTIVAGDFNDDMESNPLPARHQLQTIQPPLSAGVSFSLEYNPTAARRAEPDDVSATLDAVLVAARPQSGLTCFAAATIVGPRTVDGATFTDHEAVLAACRWR